MPENTTDNAADTTTGTDITETNVTPETEPVANRMVADPRKEGVPLFLQVQNRDQWGQWAGPLLIHEVAKRALAAATTVEEVKDIRDKALGLAAYAREASDRQLEAEAVEIRARAARRLGEMMEAQKATVGLNTGTAGKGRPNLGGSTDNPPKKDDRPTLASQGVTKTLAHEARTLARMPEGEFEEAVEAKREAIQTRTHKPPRQKRSCEQNLLDNYPVAITNTCDRVEISCDHEIPAGLTARTAAVLLLRVRGAIKNLLKLEAVLAERACGRIEARGPLQ